MRTLRIGLLLCCCLLAACGDEKTAAEQAARGEDGLPKPASASGSVTGMPNPGVADTRPAASIARDADVAEMPDSLPEDVAPLPPDAPPPPPYNGTPEMVPLPPPEPTAPPPPPPEQLRSGEPGAREQ